ncbi:hypothetical protein [Hyphomicrobium sp. D-2]|uniref:hypothetical protein n=1 Tax=Hyphomicrobium sp. D-2 TaxID=3041621 RepID=UPI0024580AAB|nr:hypothetical protein [Hyphomicrobium sp. D-2]MDH4983261.1 hypothetical protein [Hyphomicrobium sp. D-2]
MVKHVVGMTPFKIPPVSIDILPPQLQLMTQGELVAFARRARITEKRAGKRDGKPIVTEHEVTAELGRYQVAEVIAAHLAAVGKNAADNAIATFVRATLEG